MAKVPGTPSVVPNLNAVKLGVENNRLTALVCALIDAAGGEVTLSKEQSEKVWKNPKIKYVRTPTGGVSLALEGQVQPPVDPSL